MKRLFFALLFAALAVSGCSNSDNDGLDDPTPPAEQTPDDSDDPAGDETGGGDEEGDDNGDADNPENPDGEEDGEGEEGEGGGEDDPAGDGDEDEPVEKVEDVLPELPFEYDWVIVAADGTGDYRTLKEALNKISGSKYHIVHIRPGTYCEKIDMRKDRVILYGDNPETTIITYDDYAGKPRSSTSTSTIGTQDSYSFAVNAQEFVAINVTFQNTHKNMSGSGDQAVAVTVFQDRAAFYNCRLLGYQDTFYVKNEARVYCKDCYIEGNVDFICGDAALLCENCTLCVNRNDSPITAPSTSPKSDFGFVFRDCKITSLPGKDFRGNEITSIYLGRAWKAGARAVYINCEEPANLSPDGWRNRMSEDAVEALFAEYQCTGEGATAERLEQRKNNGRQLTDDEAAEYTRDNIFTRNNSTWVPMEPISL